MKKVLSGIFLLLCFMFLVTSVYAQYGGETPSYSIIIDKMVAKPGTSDYVDNLSVSDPRFAPSQDVWFKIKVKNTSNKTLTNVQVRDYLPWYLEPISGPGSFDSNTRIISWNAGDFAVDEEKTYFLKAKIFSQANLPADKGLFCVINKADARNDNVFDDDSAQLCIEKSVQGVTTVPSAGPELGLLILTGNLFGLGLGLKLKKSAK